MGFPGGASGKEPTCQSRRRDPLKEEMAAHSSVLAWRTPWTEEPGRLVLGVAKSQTQLKRLSTHRDHGINL